MGAEAFTGNLITLFAAGISWKWTTDYNLSLSVHTVSAGRSISGTRGSNFPFHRLSVFWQNSANGAIPPEVLDSLGRNARDEAR